MRLKTDGEDRIRLFSYSLVTESSAEGRGVPLARAAPAVSSAAEVERFMIEQWERPVSNGRPSYNVDPPIGLFHPVFNSFRAAMKSPDPVYEDAITYSAAMALFRAFVRTYPNERDRIPVISERLADFLGRSFQVVEASGVKSDGVLYYHWGPSVAYLAILEIKNEMGTGSADPYNQASLAYGKYWADTSRASAKCTIPMCFY
jgi:hypothetical protein